MLENLKCRGIFSRNKKTLIEENAKDLINKAKINKVILFCSKANKEIPNFDLPTKVYFYESMNSKKAPVAAELIGQINDKILLIFDDVQAVRNYPTSTTRNIVNFVCKFTPYKIIADNKLITKSVIDLFAPFYFLSKKILHANHYWCFEEDHNEVSVFDGETIYSNKDFEYLAMKIKPFIVFDLPVENDFYRAVANAPIKQRKQDITDLYFSEEK